MLRKAKAVTSLLQPQAAVQFLVDWVTDFSTLELSSTFVGRTQEPPMQDSQVPKILSPSKAGRKPIAGTRPKMKSVKLSLEHWAIAKKIGKGNCAEGIRQALDRCAEEKTL